VTHGVHRLSGAAPIRMSSSATRLKHALRILFPTIAILIILFEWSCSVRANGGFTATFSPVNPATLFYKLFRLAGLAAFTLVAFQVLTGPYMKFWEALYGTSFYRFHAYEGLLALLIALLHPSLLFSSLAYSKTSISIFTQNIPFQFYFGPLALLLMLVTVSTAGLAVILDRPRFKKGWHAIHLANYAVFILAFFHSVTIGTDLTSPKNPLRPMWVLFFIAMVMGFLYRRCRSRMRA
jgi:predicted ferric reductase